MLSSSRPSSRTSSPATSPSPLRTKSALSSSSPSPSSSSASLSSREKVEIRAIVAGRADLYLFTLSSDDRVRSAVRLIAEEEARHQLQPVDGGHIRSSGRDSGCSSRDRERERGGGSGGITRVNSSRDRWQVREGSSSSGSGVRTSSGRDKERDRDRDRERERSGSTNREKDSERDQAQERGGGSSNGYRSRRREGSRLKEEERPGSRRSGIRGPSRYLVVLPRPFGSAVARREAVMADQDATLGSLQLTSEDTVTLMSNVVLTNVYLREGSSANPNNETPAAVVPIDFGAKLKNSLGLLRSVFFDPKAPEEDFALLYSAATIDINAIDGINRWVTINESPRNQRLDPMGKITIFPISYLLTLPANTKHFLPVEREGFLHLKEPLKSGRRGGQHGKRLYFHIKDYLLFVWRSQIDLSSKKPPKRVILLDHYCVQSICDEAPVFSFSLRRDPTLGVDNTEVAMTVYSVAGLARRSKDTDPLYHISSKDLDTHQKWMEAVQSKCVNSEPTKVFGVELNTIMARKREANNKIPSMLEKCIAYLDRYALDKEGIFRISGDALDIEAYKQAFDNNQDVEFKPGTDVHVVSSLMKLYLRQLPEPLLTFDMHDCFVMAHAQLRNFDLDKDMVASKMVELLVNLSQHHNNALKVLTRFLSRVERYSDKNLMHLSNLATIFGPNLLRRPNGENERDVFKNVAAVTDITEMLISQHREIFKQVDEKTSSRIPPTASAVASASPSPSTALAADSDASSPLAPGSRLSLPSPATPLAVPALPLHMASPRRTRHLSTGTYFSPRGTSIPAAASKAQPAQLPSTDLPPSTAVSTKERSASISGTPRSRISARSRNSLTASSGSAVGTATPSSSSSGSSSGKREEREKRERRKERTEKQDKDEDDDADNKRLPHGRAGTMISDAMRLQHA